MNKNIIDLGSYPGGWSQVASKNMNNGKILAIDLKKMEKIKGVDFINGDFTSLEVQKKIINFFGSRVDVIMSDMAANTSGNKELDSFRTGELCLNAMDFAVKLLSINGIFVSKLFMGSIFKEINEKAKKNFKNVSQYKPISSKKESKEIYIICKGVLKV